MLGSRKPFIGTYFLWYYFYSTVLNGNIQNMAGAGAGAVDGAEIRDKGGTGTENK